ncbi:MAG: diacylglycerol/lipid kinase family protein [Acidimicrobiales bacterium]
MDAAVPFVCVPAGTRNHFAHGLGLDRTDPVGALGSFVGLERRVDAARVGERVFLNNVSPGTYADVVAEPRYRDRKLDTARVIVRRTARAETCASRRQRLRPNGAALRRGAGCRVRRPSALGARERLDAGVLQVSAVRARTGAALAAMVGRVAVGASDKANGWAQWETTSLTVTSPLPTLPAGVDGEAVVLVTPPRVPRAAARAAGARTGGVGPPRHWPPCPAPGDRATPVADRRRRRLR